MKENRNNVIKGNTKNIRHYEIINTEQYYFREKFRCFEISFLSYFGYEMNLNSSII